MAGTLIRTARGNIAIELLSSDDHVLTRDSKATPVLWVGVRHLDTSRHPEPEKVWPIRIRAGAIADGVPCRDLHLSPDHAVFLDGLLIPAKVLVNGITIATYPLRHVIYYHVEVEGHDVVLAEGLSVESYLNTGNRALFENHDGVIDLHPDLMQSPAFMQALRETASCAPFAESGPQAIAIRQRLLDRMPPVPMSGDPDLRVRAGEHELQVEQIGPATYRVVLPLVTYGLKLLSRVAAGARRSSRHGWAYPPSRRLLIDAAGGAGLYDVVGTGCSGGRCGPIRGTGIRRKCANRSGRFDIRAGTVAAQAI